MSSLRVVLSHMVVKLDTGMQRLEEGLRVVLSHMVVKQEEGLELLEVRLRVVLSSYGSQTWNRAK